MHVLMMWAGRSDNEWRTGIAFTEVKRRYKEHEGTRMNGA